MIKIVKPGVEIMTPLDVTDHWLPLIEKAARTCYKSEARSKDPGRFVQAVAIGRGHKSIIEHCTFTVKFVLSRSASHQLVRHRIAVYSQESQRYCNYNRHNELLVIKPKLSNHRTMPFMPSSTESWYRVVVHAYREYRYLVSKGEKPEEAREVLPNCVKTEVVSTFNLRQWRHVIKHRALNPKAQWQIRGIMQLALWMLCEVCPELFSDLWWHVPQMKKEHQNIVDVVEYRTAIQNRPVLMEVE